MKGKGREGRRTGNKDEGEKEKGREGGRGQNIMLDLIELRRVAESSKSRI